ncbi:hypothetical protein Pcac1_g14067 [Phytophthora cactorum]|nr:hypothetical protein Pcac1_g14067 [Phytophthora cactorum]
MWTEKRFPARKEQGANSMEDQNSRAASRSLYSMEEGLLVAACVRPL